MSQLYKVQGARLGCWSFCNLHAELCVPLCTCWGKGYEGVTGHNPLFPLLPLARRGGSMADGSPVVRHCWRALGWSGGKWGTEIHGKAVIPSQSLPHDESWPRQGLCRQKMRKKRPQKGMSGQSFSHRTLPGSWGQWLCDSTLEFWRGIPPERKCPHEDNFPDCAQSCGKLLPYDESF